MKLKTKSTLKMVWGVDQVEMQLHRLGQHIFILVKCCSHLTTRSFSVSFCVDDAVTCPYPPPNIRRNLCGKC